MENRVALKGDSLDILQAGSSQGVEHILTRGASEKGNTESTRAKNTQNIFGLSEEEKFSIEVDINAKKPITATLAYTKFLQAVLGEPKIGDIFTFSPDIPEYENYNGNIRANYRGAEKIVIALTKLLGKSVRLPYEQEAIDAMKIHNYLTGYRGSISGKSNDVCSVDRAWLDGGIEGKNAPYACRDRLHGSYSTMNHHHSGYSVIPYFG